jgi:hypothetical protein
MPLALHTLTMTEIPTPTGTPATRDDLRAHMPWAQAIIRDHWDALGPTAIARVTAAEAGYLYIWRMRHAGD